MTTLVDVGLKLLSSFSTFGTQERSPRRKVVEFTKTLTDTDRVLLGDDSYGFTVKVVFLKRKTKRNKKSQERKEQFFGKNKWFGVR